MSNIPELLDTIHRRAIDMHRTGIDVVKHLTADQHDAVMSASDAAGGTNTRSGHSDPTPALSARLAPYRTRERNIRAELNKVLGAINAVERVMAGALSDNQPVETTDADRCPGWNYALIAQLGGCGKIREENKRPDGTALGLRPLCAGCRTALTRARRRAREHGMCDGHLTEYVNDHAADGTAPLVNWYVLEKCDACTSPTATDETGRVA